MKKTGKRILSAILLAAMLLSSSLALTSCNLASFLSPTETVSISKTEINEKGELIISYSNGKKENLGVVVGKDGEKGEDGEDTSVRVTSATINAKGELILYYSNGTSENLGVVVGKDGEDAIEPPTIQDIEVNVEVSGSAESATAAVAAATTSVVSVIANFRSGNTTVASAGSGVIYSLDKTKGDAIVITNYHVLYNESLGRIADAIGISVYGSPLSSQIITASFVGGSMREDIAVLKVTGSDFLKTSVATAAVLASSDAVHPGDTAIAIGNPRGHGISATYGKINVASEMVDSVVADGKTEVKFRLMRIDTAVNRGNSGGGLFDAQGRLIGIVNLKSIVENIENIGYAIPIDKVSAIVENILYFCTDGDYVSPYKPTFGISIRTVDSVAVFNEEAGAWDIKETIEIDDLDAGSIGASALKVGDRFISVTVGGKTLAVTRSYHLTESVIHLRPGETITYKVLRDGVEIDVSVTPPVGAYNPF